MAILIYLPICVFYYKQAKQSFLALCIYMCIPSFVVLFSGLRQAVATSLVVVAFQYIKGKRLIKFLVLLACAFFFHRTSICFIFAYPMYHLNIKKEKYPIVFIVLLLVLLGRDFLIRHIFDFAILINDKYESYELSNTNSYTMIAFYLLLLVYSLLLCKDTKSMVGLRNLLVMVVFFQIFALSQSNVARLGYYYLMILPLYIVQCFEDLNFNEKKERDLINSVIMFAFIILGWLLISGADSMQLQYKFWWG